LTFYHVCDDCGNRINLSNRMNAELPYNLKLRAKYHRSTMQQIETSYHLRLKGVYTRRHGRYQMPYLRKLIPYFYTRNVIDYDTVDSEYEAEDSFWSMEDIIVVCPSCGKVDYLPAHETPDVRMVPCEALCSLRT